MLRSFSTFRSHRKSLFQKADVLSDQGIHFDILALQEVGGLTQGKVTPGGFLDADDPALQMHEELGYWVVGTEQLESDLGQAILVDKSFATAVLHSLEGWRFIGAQILHKSGSQLCILSRLLERAGPLPTLIAADWNAPQTANLDSQALELSCLAAEENLQLLLPGAPPHGKTKHGFFAFRPAYPRCLARPILPVGLPQVVNGLAALLPLDHQLVSCPLSATLLPQKLVAKVACAHTPPLATWSSQRSLARACQHYRPPSRKFQDSNAFKELCRIRNHTLHNYTPLHSTTLHDTPLH